MRVAYRTSVTSRGGRRDGHVVSDDGLLDLRVAPPPELGGDGSSTNPEQLFAAGYAACFDSALHGVAQRLDIEVADVEVEVEVELRKAEGFDLACTITVHATAAPDDLQRLAEATAQVCPYSKATRGNVPTEVRTVPRS